MENDNHPLTLGTYRWDEPIRCSQCGKPVALEDQVMSGEFSYRHRSCIPPPKCVKCGAYIREVNCVVCNDPR